ncbi:5'/3'-nucleotidase SurE [Comamonas humi]
MKTLIPRCAAALGLAMASPAFALNILVSNDDGLSSNVKALYDALKAAGHDVIVSVPCTNQSGRGGAAVQYSKTVIVVDNDKTQLDANGGGCRSGAARIGDPANGPMLKEGFTNGDYHYVHGTPVQATNHGLDVLAPARWGKAPDLVLSGPNEGENAGPIVIYSGTVGNVQVASMRGVPAIAVSAGNDTRGDATANNPYSAAVAQLTIKLLDTLRAKAGSGPLLPKGVALNVNIPPAPTANLPFAFSRQGSFNLYDANGGGTPTAAQAEDEGVVSRTKVAVTAMQTGIGFEHRPAAQQWLRLHLGELFGQ